MFITSYTEEYRNRGQGKKGGKQSLVKLLMEKTKARRHQWIRTEKPLVSEITNKFPHLNLSRWVSTFAAIKMFLTVTFRCVVSSKPLFLLKMIQLQ